jgi:hypothetical protein
MKPMRLVAGFAAVVMTVTLIAGAASAQATRTWVSGVGDDANPCSRTAPCKTFAGAISKTAPAGEINCLDPGGFGALTITKAITISCQTGTAGVLVSGTNGLVVVAGPADQVFLDGLDIEGLGAPGNSPSLSGLNVISAGKVTLRNSIIRGFGTSGINGAPTGSNGFHLDVINCVIADNQGSGISLAPSGSGPVRLLLTDTRVSGNTGDGVVANATGSSGSIEIMVHDSDVTKNSGSGFDVFSSGAADIMQIDSSTAFDNAANGVVVNGAGAFILITRMSVSGNGTGLQQLGAGTLGSYLTNSVNGNNTDVSGTITTFGQR